MKSSRTAIAAEQFASVFANVAVPSIVVGPVIVHRLSTLVTIVFARLQGRGTVTDAISRTPNTLCILVTVVAKLDDAQHVGWLHVRFLGYLALVHRTWVVVHRIWVVLIQKMGTF